MKSLKEFALGREYFVAAHRGSSGTAPENTMAAFREAIEAGANMIETDVQLTSDGHIVAFHDLKMLKKSNGKNSIGELTLQNLQRLDAGGWFDEKFKSEKIPLLSDIFELIKDKIYLLIELKTQKSGGHSILINRLINIIDEFKIADNVLIASFHYKLLSEIKKLRPDFPVGAIKIPFDFRVPSKIQKETGCDVFICAVNELNDKIVEDAEKNNIFMGTYSIDTEEDLNTALKYNVKAIGTNYPARIIGMLNTMK